MYCTRQSRLRTNGNSRKLKKYNWLLLNNLQVFMTYSDKTEYETSFLLVDQQPTLHVKNTNQSG